MRCHANTNRTLQQCTICDKKVRTPTELRQHMRSHTGSVCINFELLLSAANIIKSSFASFDRKIRKKSHTSCIDRIDSNS